MPNGNVYVRRPRIQGEKNIMVQTVIDGRTITLKDEDRRTCEVWTRVMGYYRPVSEFNIGKKSEHRERTFFRENVVAPSLN